MKKILTLIGLMLIVACSVMIVSSCDNAGWGKGDGDPSLLQYELSYDETYYTVTGIGDYKGRHLVIPEEYNGLPVKGIDSNAFSCLDMTEEEKEASAIAKLKKVTVSDSVLYIGDVAFAGTNIKKIYIGSNTFSISQVAFYKTDNLRKIKVSKDNKDYTSKNGVLYEKRMFVLLKYPPKKSATSFRIPEVVERIEDSAFEGAVNLRRVNLGKNLRTIGSWAFEGSGIRSIKIPFSVKSIGTEAFKDCAKLKKVELGGKVDYIPNGLFYGCESLTKIVIPGRIQEIGEGSFAECDKLTKVFYEGDENDWSNVKFTEYWWFDADTIPETAKIYCYSKERPSGEGNYWRYVLGMPIVWLW